MFTLVLLLATADGACDLYVLARICSSSKQLRSHCLELLRGQPLKQSAVLLAGVNQAAAIKLLQEQPLKQVPLLLAMLQEVEYGCKSLQRRSIQSVWWMLDTALPPHTAAQLLLQRSLIHQLIRIPSVPRRLATGLCQRGLCVPYTDIAAAACGAQHTAGAANLCNLRKGLLLFSIISCAHCLSMGCLQEPKLCAACQGAVSSALPPLPQTSQC